MRLPPVRSVSSATMMIAVASMAWMVGCAPEAVAQETARTRRLIEVYERESRVEDLQIPRVLATLGVEPGMSIADIGAGSGLFSRPLARAVGEEGVVYAVDIAPGMLSHIEATAEAQGLENLRTVLGDAADPKLPRPVDLILMSDMLHQVRDKEGYLRNLRPYLEAGGRIAVIDLLRNWPTRPDMSYTLDDLEQMMGRLGYRTLETHDFILDHFFAVYGIPDPG